MLFLFPMRAIALYKTAKFDRCKIISPLTEDPQNSSIVFLEQSLFCRGNRAGEIKALPNNNSLIYSMGVVLIGLSIG